MAPAALAMAGAACPARAQRCSVPDRPHPRRSPACAAAWRPASCGAPRTGPAPDRRKERAGGRCGRTWWGGWLRNENGSYYRHLQVWPAHASMAVCTGCAAAADGGSREYWEVTACCWWLPVRATVRLDEPSQTLIAVHGACRCAPYVDAHSSHSHAPGNGFAVLARAWRWRKRLLRMGALHFAARHSLQWILSVNQNKQVEIPLHSLN